MQKRTSLAASIRQASHSHAAETLHLPTGLVLFGQGLTTPLPCFGSRDEATDKTRR
jgi:hypothetical protein